MNRLASIIVSVIFFYSCDGSKNYNKAYIVKEKNNLFIKIIGNRTLRPNSPVDIIEGKSYNDSLVIPIPTLKDVIIKGEDIPVPKGYYKYTGNIVIKGNDLKVSLLYENYDDKKLESSPWNGKYKLVNKTPQ